RLEAARRGHVEQGGEVAVGARLVRAVPALYEAVDARRARLADVALDGGAVVGGIGLFGLERRLAGAEAARIVPGVVESQHEPALALRPAHGNAGGHREERGADD